MRKKFVIGPIYVAFLVWLLGVLYWGRAFLIPFFWWPEGAPGLTCMDMFADPTILTSCKKLVGFPYDFGDWQSRNLSKTLPYLFFNIVCPLAFIWIYPKLKAAIKNRIPVELNVFDKPLPEYFFSKNSWLLPIPLTVAGVFFLMSGYQNSYFNWLGQRCNLLISPCLHPELFAVGAGFLIAAFLIYQKRKPN